MKKINKLISILLVAVMLMSMAPLSLTAFAASPVPYDGVPVTPQVISSGNYAKLGLTDTNWSQFNGYYAIRNAKELYGFADIVNNSNAGATINLNAVLLQDIVINANGGNTYDWRPLYGTGNDRDFKGTIDGNGHYISGIYCTLVSKKIFSNDCVSGFIGEFSGTVKNLIIKDSTFAPSQHIGQFGGLGAITGYPKNCTIENCRVENTKLIVPDNYGQIGGLTGYGNGLGGTTIKNCVSLVTISGGGSSNPISVHAPYTNCYTSAYATHTCANISVEHKEVKATCEYPGLSSYKYCLVCGNETSGTKTETPATGHTWQNATCQAPKTCSACDLTEGSTESHKYTTYTLSSNAMCGANAKETASCDYGCGTTDTREISGTALVHSYTYSASGNTVTAVCANGENCPNTHRTLTISAPADLYVDGTAKEAIVENNLGELYVVVGDSIKYSTADGSAPKTAGTYTASITIGGATASVQFELVKRSAIAENFVYTAPENLVYDGTAKYATVEVSSEITGMGAITVSYYKDGKAVEPVDAGTYTVKVSTADSDKYYAINDVALASFTIAAKDISDGSIILGKALTYNGKEQTQTVEKVITTNNLEATFDISDNKATNVGVYLLTVTGTGNFMGEAKIAYEIAVNMNGVDLDQLRPMNVKATDREKIEFIYNQLDNAFRDYADAEKRNEWDNNKSYCVELLRMIESVANHIESFENELAKYDINTVTSDDTADLESFQNSVGNFYNDYFDNLTDEQVKKVSDIFWAIEKLETRISDVAKEITRITNAVNSYDENTVKSSDKDDVIWLKADIKSLTDGQNITDEEREYLKKASLMCDKLIFKIVETSGIYNMVIAAANGYDEATVTSADKDALVKLNDDIYALAITDNLTEEEKENLQAAHDKVLGLIDKITNISDEIKRIIAEVDKYVFESVKSSDKADIEELIADIKALLDTQNITADERALLEGADETCDKLIAKIDETVAEINRINDATNAYDEAAVTSTDKADIEKLLADIKALTDGDNITDSERNHLNGNEATLKALLDKIGATADEIARIETAVNGYVEESVKLTDKADIEKLKADIKALTDATNITEDERAKLGELDAKIDALVKKIDDTKAEIDRINEAVNGYDEETVKSSDIPELSKLVNDIKALVDGDNLTEDEKTALEETDKAIDELVEKLTEVAEEIKRVDEAVKSYDEETVKSTNSNELSQLKEDIQSLIDSGNVTENEKATLEDMITNIEGLEDKIEEIENQLEEIKGIENGYNPETVTSDDKAAIEDKIAEIEAVNPDNLTDEQKAEYEEIKAGFEALLEEIAATEKDVADIGVELEMFDEKRVTIFWEDEIEALKAKIDELLADENMGEAEKAKLGEYKAQAEKLIEIINDPCEYFSMRLFCFIWDALHWLSSHVEFIFNWIAAMF